MLVADFDGNLKISSQDKQLEADPALTRVGQINEQPKAVVDSPLVSDWGFVVEPQAESTTQSPSDIQLMEEPAQPEFMQESVVLPSVVETAETKQVPPLQEIVDFANSSQATAREGVLFYDIRISKIDDGEIKKLVKECLEDSKLRVDLAKSFSTLKNGTITIAKVNAVKASIIISRLKELPIELSWIQSSTIAPSQKDEGKTIEQ